MCVPCIVSSLLSSWYSKLPIAGWLSHEINSLKVNKYITNTSKSKYSPYDWL